MISAFLSVLSLASSNLNVYQLSVFLKDFGITHNDKLGDRWIAIGTKLYIYLVCVLEIIAKVIFWAYFLAIPSYQPYSIIVWLVVMVLVVIIY